MYNDMLVGDGVLHAYNNSFENARNETAEKVLGDIMGLANGGCAPGTEHSEAQWFRNFTADEVAEATFLESDVDFGVYHSTPIFDYFKDGYSSLESGIEMRNNNPKRVKCLGCVDPLSSDATDEMERQVEELDVDGFKFYPSFYRNGGKVKPLRLDDGLLPLVEKADELGVENVAVHKVFPVGPVGQHHLSVGDVADTASMFPDLKFELLHPDLAFIEEIKLMLATHDNVWANLEFSTVFMFLQPRRFAEILGELLLWGDAERILFSTGVPLVHPQAHIEAFWNFEYPDDMKDEYPELTDDLKRKLMSENLLDLYGWDADELRAHVQEDGWAQRREAEGRPEPWSGVELEAEAAADD
ncbi:amidohydrolase family protein [Haloglomus litoreum]|uniref:amidohydrolase family protein n=1 Tax=Haloglomus litoreum TaxID=3034026 RepID=UPI0023E762F5|nr:amidohydrolase family protein [Haloglomus sp. DT116]